ncbi:MAG: DUF3021 domain-containing protein [Tissierellia bacterium]|nr:DUF3021 domain-containing protein [Tissierellia bacterium]
MKKKNHLLQNILKSTTMAGAFTLLALVIMDLTAQGNLHLEDYSLTKSALATLAIGLGFGLPAGVYEKEELTTPQQFTIHMGIGILVMTLATYTAGWLPKTMGAWAITGTILAQTTAALLIWILHYLHQKKLAQKINQQIQQLQK